MGRGLLAALLLGQLLAVALVARPVTGPAAGDAGGGGVAGAAPMSVPIARFDLTLYDPTRSSPARWPYPPTWGRTMPTVVLHPTAGGPWPVIAFAHGFNTVPDDYLPLLEAIASAGYVVVAPALPGASSAAAGTPNRSDLPAQPGDLSYAITWALAAGADAGSPLFGQVDGARIGAAGHSDGGSVVAALAMHGPSIDGRVRGVAALAAGGWYDVVQSGSDWFVYGKDRWVGNNAAAVLLVQGDADTVNPWQAAAELFGAANPPKAMATLPGAGHLSPFVDGPQAPAVRALVAGFLDATVRGDVSGRARLVTTAEGNGYPLWNEGLGAEPFGNLDEVTVGVGGVTRLRGWTLDPDTTAPIDVHLHVDGVPAVATTASLERPDVGAAFGMGSAHGFDVGVALADGPHRVCAYAIDVGVGDTNPEIGCRSVTVNRSPFGNLELVAPEWPPTPQARVLLRGWAIDPDTPDPVTLHVYVDGVGTGVLTADQPRPDVDAAFPGSGATRGFAGSVPVLAAGSHTVCVYAINQGAGASNTTLGCRGIVVDRDPIGSIDGVGPSECAAGCGAGYSTIWGWAIDPDSLGPTIVHVYLDGSPIAAVVTGWPRLDVAAAYPAYGTNRGWGVTMAIGTTWRQLCAYGINEGPGTTNRTLGCITRP